jgi:malonyl-CoA O-methyltransferase
MGAPGQLCVFMTVVNPARLNPLHVRANFDRVAGRFERADFVHRAAADGLMQRMQPMTVAPKLVVDLGSALGAGSRLLARRFPRARILSIDLSAPMLSKARQSDGWFSKLRQLQADARQLPLATGSVDCLFANLLLPWIDDLPGCLREIARVLRKDGVFLFSTAGPASLAEIRDAWRRIDSGLHVHHFPDMHNLGDALVHAGLGDPVLDVDYLSVTYRDTEAIFADLAAAGARNSLCDRRHTLTGKGRVARFREQLRHGAIDGIIELKLELVYGHAFGRGIQALPGEFRLAPEDIGRRRK